MYATRINVNDRSLLSPLLLCDSCTLLLLKRYSKEFVMLGKTLFFYEKWVNVRMAGTWLMQKKKSGGGRASIWSNSWDAPWDACVWVDCTPGSSFVFMGTLEGSTWWIGLGRVTCFGDPNLVLGFILAHLWILWACGEWTSRWEISNYLSKK